MPAPGDPRQGPLGRGLLLTLPPPWPASGGLSALMPRSPAATPLPIPPPHPSPQVGLPYRCHRAQLHHCQQVFSKLCTKDSRRLFLQRLNQDLSAAQLVENQGCKCLSSPQWAHRIPLVVEDPPRPEWLPLSDEDGLLSSHVYNGPLGTAVP